MLQQKEILEWLQKFSINQIKHFLTIKHPLHLDYLRKILTFKPDTKPKERMEHGYSETKINNETTIYQRDKFRYKKNKEQKKEMDEVFFQNITVSRQNPWSLSVTKSFIRSGKLSECMLLLSDGQVFSYIQYPLIKSGSEGQSFWFKTSNISSFSGWLIHFFQMEILEAYRNHEAVKAINPFVFADQCLTLAVVKQSLIQTINLYTDKSSSAKALKSQRKKDDTDILEISKEESGYLLQKCLQRFQQGGRDVGEVVFQYEWISGDRTSKINKVLQKLAQSCMSQYHSYQIDCKVKEIEDLTTACKKKKKKSKKNKELKEDKEQNNNQQAEIQNIKKQTSILKSPKKAEEEILEQKPIMEEKQQKKQITPKNLGPVAKKYQAEQNHPIQQPINLNLQKQLKILKQKQLQEISKSKKLIQERINELINFYYFKLYESSAAFNKYRQVCIEMVKTEILSIQIPCIQQLVLFGSYSIDFAIKQSDLDFVLVIDEKASPQHAIYQLKDHLKATKWLRNCNIIQGKILSILQFQIMLSQIQLPKLKDNKKLMNTTIHVDLTVTNSKDNQCLRNTCFMKNLLEEYPDLKVIGLILKELLKITDLNKNYTGGIGSYTLTMLAFNVLKARKVAFDGNYIHQLTTIAMYMAQDFVPYETLVSSRGNIELKANPQMALNVEDPQSGTLLKTNAKRINLIVKLFTELYSLLENTQAACLKIGMEERKKMKRSFFEEWNRLFKPEKQLFEALQ